MDRLPIALQNTYSDLLSRLEDARVADHAGEAGGFVRKVVKGRVYWYHQSERSGGSRKQVYVGPETPELLSRIERHREFAASDRERAELVRSLARSRAFPPLPAPVGQVLAALAESGVFRLRAVLVGTVAFQAYAPMLGIRLRSAALATEDIDVAQFRSISIAVEDTAPDVLATLHGIDPKFEPIGSIHDRAPAAGYVGRSVKIEFLTPMRGPAEDAPAELPALGTGAQPLRFLDYLIYREQPAALLHGAGVLVNVPDPARYAWHKLIVSQRRTVNREKGRKDIMQAELLLDALTTDRPGDVRDMWAELAAEGRRTWQALALDGLEGVRSEIRDRVRSLIGA